MATNLLWFVMAGFLLGFATSTLWEWFYFRKERLKLTDRRIRELEAKLRDSETATDSTTPTSTIPTVASVTGSSVTGVSRTSAWGDTAYRSPGVFLESEEYEADDDEPAVVVRELPRPPLANTPFSAPASTTAGPSSSAVAPITPAPGAATPSAVTPSTESNFVPRNEPTPADALRAKRGDSPRSRQELLAALRRNSDAAQRGQLPRTDGETSSVEVPHAVRPDERMLVVPPPSVREEQPGYEKAPTRQPHPKPPSRAARKTTLELGPSTDSTYTGISR